MKKELYLFLMKLSLAVQKKDMIFIHYRQYRDNLLVLLGPSCCGKSSIAKRLQENSGILSIEYDKLFHQHLNYFFEKNANDLYQTYKTKYRENLAHYIFNSEETTNNQALRQLEVLALRNLSSIRHGVFSNILEMIKQGLSQRAIVVVQAFGKNCLRNYQEFTPYIVMIYLRSEILKQRLEQRNQQALENNTLLEVRSSTQVQKQTELLFQRDSFGKFTFIQPDSSFDAEGKTSSQLAKQILTKFRAR